MSGKNGRNLKLGARQGVWNEGGEDRGGKGQRRKGRGEEEGEEKQFLAISQYSNRPRTRILILSIFWIKNEAKKI